MLRPVWLVAQSRLLQGGEPLTVRDLTALSWAGTRGVITLAAIFTLPLVTDSGAPYPDRDLLRVALGSATRRARAGPVATPSGRCR